MVPTGKTLKDFMDRVEKISKIFAKFGFKQSIGGYRDGWFKDNATPEWEKLIINFKSLKSTTEKYTTGGHEDKNRKWMHIHFPPIEFWNNDRIKKITEFMKRLEKE